MITQESKLALLSSLYAIHDRFCAQSPWACAEKCAACCTRNVTLTTLEGAAVLRHLKSTGQTQWLDRVAEAVDRPRFQPRVTINHLAELCARDEDIPEETIDPRDGPCPVLSDDLLCPLYAVRPFGCRAMLSRTRCAQLQEADMPDLTLTVNTIFQQYIEAVDLPGLTGNLVDVLLHLSAPEKPGTNRPAPDSGGTLLQNRPIPVLMIPPEHREPVAPLLQEIQDCIRRAYLQSGLAR